MEKIIQIFLLLFCVNWKIDLCLSIPIALVVNTIVIMNVYKNEDGNMLGFKDPAAFKADMIIRGFILLFIIVIALMDHWKENMRHFLE